VISPARSEMKQLNLRLRKWNQSIQQKKEKADEKERVALPLQKDHASPASSNPIHSVELS